eukprot:10066285-Heterocapsa_arctica.AAC.1
MALNWKRTDPAKMEALIKEFVYHLRWCFELYEMQHRERTHERVRSALREGSAMSARTMERRL